MRLRGLLPLLLAASGLAAAQDNTPMTLTGTITTSISDATMPTGTYATYSTTRTLDNPHDEDSNTTTPSGSPTGTSSSENATMSVTTTSDSLTLLVGGHHTSVIGNASNATASHSPTPSSSPVVNSQPCNGYTDFCNRKYSNITNVVAHNSPFVKPGNVASNQALQVEAQLNDGIRALQFQTHFVNNTLYLCHTTCDLLNVGTVEAYLTRVNKWIRQNPYEVITIIMGNYDYIEPGNFTAPIEASGLMDMVWTPPKVPMGIEDWPTLSSFILSGKRVIFTLDYMANQTAYPWLMDEFSQVWETPFSPTDRHFPCTQQRPPGLSQQDAEQRMYMANHNLNLNLDIANLNILIPNTAQLNVTNAVDGFGSLGWMAKNCTKQWNRPPNFLLVDYYNYGNFNGSVFEVAAEMNNVTYNGKCCGMASAGVNLTPRGILVTVVMIGAVQFLVSMF